MKDWILSNSPDTRTEFCGGRMLADYACCSDVHTGTQLAEGMRSLNSYLLNNYFAQIAEGRNKDEVNSFRVYELLGKLRYIIQGRSHK